MALSRDTRNRISTSTKSLPKVPVWKGPQEDGVTQTLLSRFLACRERFRLLVMEGLGPAPKFSHRLEYGQMWHVCEEAHADGGLDWERQLTAHCRTLATKYPLEREQVDHWSMVCRTQFPLYVKYWRNHKDVLARTPLLQEEVFNVPYKLPSGRVVRLRGKWDSVDLVGKGHEVGIWLQENKTKGDINPGSLRQQLTFDLQTMLYLVALDSSYVPIRDMSRDSPDRKYTDDEMRGLFKKCPIHGVRYNVIRRPLSGGKGSIVRHKATKSKPAETKESFYRRLGKIIEDDPGYFFMRWNVTVTPADLARFRRECLDPVLESLCRWYEHVTYCQRTGQDLFGKVKMDGSFGCTDEVQQFEHWRHPFGVFNPMLEGGSSELDSYLESGSMAGLARTEDLFPELKE